MRTVSTRAVAIAMAAALITSTAPAYADTAEALSASVVSGANAGIKNAMRTVPLGTVAQVPPVNQVPVGGAPQPEGLPTGFTYTVDFSMAYPYGNIGSYGKKWLPGGMDIVAGYGFNPTTRLLVSHYDLQHYPYSFNSGTVPLYLQGFPNPIGCVDLSGGTAGGCNPGTPIDVTTKDSFTLVMLEKLFDIGHLRGRELPIVITPTYVSRNGKIDQSGNGTDVVPFDPVPGSPNIVANVPTRTAQLWSVAFTMPFLKTPKMFGTFTAAPAWLTHLNGINIQNRAQLYQILYLEYTPTSRTKIFFEPQSSRDYLPTDAYAQHLVAYFAGISEQIGKNGFVQLVLNSGGPTNESPYGVTALTCTQLPCTPSQVVPTIGGLKATQLQLQFGIGTPSVIQF